MDRQILSQEEINALLRDADSSGGAILSPEQKDALGEIGNISFGSASTALSGLLNKRVVIDTPTVFVTTQRELVEQHPIPYVLVEVSYKKGLEGSNVFILKEYDAAIIADLMMGGDGHNPKQSLDQMELSAVGEAMNQMIGSASTSLSTIFSKRIEIAPPEVKAVDFANGEIIFSAHNMDEQMAAISFKLQIEGLADSEVMLLIPYQLAVNMVDSLSAVAEKGGPSTPPSQPKPAPEPEYQRIPEPVMPETPSLAAASAGMVAPSTGMAAPSMSTQSMGAQGLGTPNMSIPNSIPNPDSGFSGMNQTPVMVQPAQFGAIGSMKPGKEAAANIGLILDVPLQVTVELGSARMKIKEILELGLGSVIELDKLAGDPVDIFVNGKLIAKGEVVVIDENFGIKVTDIISPIERAHTLQ